MTKVEIIGRFKIIWEGDSFIVYYSVLFESFESSLVKYVMYINHQHYYMSFTKTCVTKCREELHNIISLPNPVFSPYVNNIRRKLKYTDFMHSETIHPQSKL